MNISRIGACAALAICLSAVAADKPPVTVSRGYMNGSSFQQFSEVMRRNYVVGVVDGFFYSPAFGAANIQTDWMVTCLKGWTAGQLMAVVDKWLANNPAKWHEPMHSLVHAALLDACP